MILTEEEKKRITDTLFWMIKEMKHNYDQTKGNFEEGSQGDYSPELKTAIGLLEYVKEITTITITGHHTNPIDLNCREFRCLSNVQGLCSLSTTTLISEGSLIMGNLKCIEAVVKKSKKKNEGEL